MRVESPAGRSYYDVETDEAAPAKGKTGKRGRLAWNLG